MTNFLNRDEASKMFSVRPATITTWMNDGTLPEGTHWTKISNKVYFNRAALESMLPGGSK